MASGWNGLRDWDDYSTTSAVSHNPEAKDSEIRSSLTGGELLANLASFTTPLTDQEIAKVARYIDEDTESQIHQVSAGWSSYRSTDLYLGDLVGTQQPVCPDPAVPELSTAAAEHFSLDLQDAAFQFVKSDARIEKALKHPCSWIQLKGIARKFYHYQLYAAFWLLKEERGDRRGSIEADLMGLGKTTIAYLYLLLNFFLTENIKHIDLHPDRHCSKVSQQDDGNTRIQACPSRDLWPIACACEALSVTRKFRLAPRPGAALLLVPASLLARWVTEWKALGVKPSPRPRLYIHHSDFPGRAIPQSRLHHLTLRPKLTTTVGSDTDLELATDKYPHHFIVITTIESYYRQVLMYGGSQRLWRRSVIGQPTKEDYTDGLAWARVVRDEAHLTPNWSTTLYRILESLANNGWALPNYHAFTATPTLRNGVADILASIRAINMFSPALITDPIYAKYTSLDWLTDLAQKYKVVGQNSTTDSPDSDIADLCGITSQLLVAYMIRRHSQSIQNGKVLVVIPPLERYDILCPNSISVEFPLRMVEGMLKAQVNKAWASQVSRWKTRLHDIGEMPCKMKLLLDNLLLPRILATIPALSMYRSTKMLTWSYIQSTGWHLDPSHSRFFTDLDRLEDSSGKLQALRTLISRLDHCQDAFGRPEKLVIVSEFPVICFIVLCFCLKLKADCEWIHAELSSQEREILVRVFQDDQPPVLGVGRGRPFRIIIGTIGILGQGLTLTKAHRLVLMEPNLHAAVESQVGDRVHRLGSRTDKCWFYRLLNPDSTLEKFVIAQQQRQQRIQDWTEWLRFVPEVHNDDWDHGLAGLLALDQV